MLRKDCKAANGPNDVWAMDFMHDQLAPETKLRILTAVRRHNQLAGVK